MKVYKFGGASIKDAKNLTNVAQLLQKTGYKNTLIIASAMGKTTNALEVVVENYFSNRIDLKQSVNVVYNYHINILNELFIDKAHQVYTDIEIHFEELNCFLLNNKSPNYNYVYDQIVSFGEIIATKILHHVLYSQGIITQWIDAKELIKTDATYRDANIDWQRTQTQIRETIDLNKIYITQGFIGSDANGFSTTLGREGSDYTGAIFAYALEAESLTIWKDVKGVLNADPRYFKHSILLEHISYQEAIELAFYGATVIHPKTLQPLRQKEIPLYVKSFLEPELTGTNVSLGSPLIPDVPCYIVKKQQMLISLRSKDFSFMIEQNIADIFNVLSDFGVKVNLIQNSAISFSLCVEDRFNNFEKVRATLADKFKISYNENVSLYTIRHFKEDCADKILQGKTLLLKQVSRETMQIVTKE